MIRRDDIHRMAREAGFDACGVTRLHIVCDVQMERYDRWIASGMAASMGYMANHREIRRDPTLLLPGAKTIVCLAMSYTPSQSVEGFAHYAHGQDYHDILRRRASELAERLTCDSEAVARGRVRDASGSYRVCVDTAPLFERYWACEAGLGWIGRNCQLHIPHCGSEYFLCEILLTDEVDSIDSPVKARCGTCRRCIDNCPTGALQTDGTVDARLCNSYLTIEHRGEWTQATPSKGCLYGCDVCQTVCPWQRFRCQTSEPAFEPSEALLAMTAADWQNLTEEKFRELFRHSAVKRAKYEGLKRNINHQYNNEDKHTTTH